MRVATINIDKAVEETKRGIDSIIKGELPQEGFTESAENVLKVVDIFMERISRNRPGKKSSEKSKGKSGKKNDDSKKRSPRKQLPSERYPDAEVVEKELDFKESPKCSCCSSTMMDTGLKEKSEQLTVIPKKYFIIRFLRNKYECTSCSSNFKAAPMPPRIAPGSSYSDDMIMDVALSKYCDLLPIERYVQMASRNGLEGLPANSLIGVTHLLAEFLVPIYQKQEKEVLAAKVLSADETPHRMLEGYKEKKSYYLWGFRTITSCFLDIQNTRAGSVAGEFLKKSACTELMSDVYSGYNKAVSDTNTYRESLCLALIYHLYCNSHARRKFKDAEENYPEDVEIFIRCYAKIYKLEKQVKKAKTRDEKLKFRRRMTIYFNAMLIKCGRLSEKHSAHSSIRKATGYFSRNFEGFTRCLSDPDFPLDNNDTERLLRSFVVGRKTWYGTHSERGARTMAILFTIVEGCKINGVNPREYLPFVVDLIHKGQEPPTPYEYAVKFLHKKKDEPSVSLNSA